ncbi:Uncharacterized protein HZ326_9377, partial [Fusarium oxysporum f. sp. albedinis]
MRVAGVGKSMGQDPTKWTGRHAVKNREGKKGKKKTKKNNKPHHYKT